MRQNLNFSSGREVLSKRVSLSAGKEVLCYLGIAGVTCVLIASSAYAAESPVQVASIEKLGATIKKRFCRIYGVYLAFYTKYEILDVMMPLTF